jgi:hypothetical protein
MLSKEEELRLEACLDMARVDVKNDKSFYIKPETVLWLTEKLKETNNELNQVHTELYKTNKDFADYVETHE